jgi:putative two-component system response regulator
VSRDRLLRARIVAVDDQPPNLRLLERLLGSAGFQSVQTVTSGHEAVEIFRHSPPDLLILDLHMPDLDGFGVLERLAPWVQGPAYVPVLMVTADQQATVRQRALALGAKDFLAKPFNRTEVVLRILNLLETRFLYLQLQEHKQALEATVRSRTHELELARLETLDRLALAADYRDDSTGAHTRRVGDLAARLAEVLGLSEADVELLHRAAPLHDIGKVGLPDAVLVKDGPLGSDEMALMRTHPAIGARILSGSRVGLLVLAQEIAESHHERWDGQGYPHGLAGDRIPSSGRIVALADAFDAMTHPRRYKPQLSLDEALAEVARESGHQFEPRLVDALFRLNDLGGLRPFVG